MHARQEKMDGPFLYWSGGPPMATSFLPFWLCGGFLGKSQKLQSSRILTSTSLAIFCASRAFSSRSLPNTCPKRGPTGRRHGQKDTFWALHSSPGRRNFDQQKGGPRDSSVH